MRGARSVVRNQRPHGGHPFGSCGDAVRIFQLVLAEQGKQAFRQFGLLVAGEIQQAAGQDDGGGGLGGSAVVADFVAGLGVGSGAAPEGIQFQIQDGELGAGRSARSGPKAPWRCG